MALSGSREPNCPGDDLTGTLLIDGRVAARLEMATTARTRARGLLGRSGVDGAIWLTPCWQVHTMGMRFPIDVAFIDRRGRVLRTKRLRPWRLSPLAIRAVGVLEAEAGAFARWGIVEGAQVELRPDDWDGTTPPLPRRRWLPGRR